MAYTPQFVDFPLISLLCKGRYNVLEGCPTPLQWTPDLKKDGLNVSQMARGITGLGKVSHLTWLLEDNVSSL